MSALVDSHCHLNFDPLGQDIAGVLARARDAGVEHMLCVSVTLETFPQVKALADAHDNVFASVGVHPNEKAAEEPTVEKLVSLAAQPRVIAIGETGLDYYRSDGELDWQRERFRTQIRAARHARKPLIIHSREAPDDTIRIMMEEGADQVGGVMHCFTESWDLARRALDLGFYISFSGIVTFRNAGTLREVARKVPADRLLVETDCPYLAPVPHRGKTNEPAFVRYVAECIAQLRATRAADIAQLTTRNFFSLFPTRAGD